jgi:rod shape-determining protein MreD
MRFLRFALVVAVLLLVTVRYPPSLTGLGLTPAWLFLPVLLYGLKARAGPAIFLAWLTGLTVDLLSIEPLGLHAFLYGATAFLVVKVRGHLFSSHPGTQAVLACGLTLAMTLALLLRLNLAESEFRMAGKILPAVLLSLMTGAAFPLLGRVDTALGLTEGFREGERRV